VSLITVRQLKVELVWHSGVSIQTIKNPQTDNCRMPINGTKVYRCHLLEPTSAMNYQTSNPLR